MKIVRSIAWMTAVSLFAFCSTAAAGTTVPHFSNPTQEEFTTRMGGPGVIQAIHQAGRIEVVRVQREEWRPGASINDLKVSEIGSPVVLDEKTAARVKTVFTDRGIYFAGFSACIFDPGVKFIFHGVENKTVVLVVCLKCHEIQVNVGGIKKGFINFSEGALIVDELAAEIFPKDKEIAALLREAQKNERWAEQESARWLAGAPKSIQPLWENAVKDRREPDIATLKTVLEQEYPGKSQRILALLEWNGSRSQQFGSSNGYDDTLVRMLDEYSVNDVAAALRDAKWNDRLKNGATWLFVHWGYSRRDEIRKLPSALKKILLDYAAGTHDGYNLSEARDAFGSE